MKLREGLIIAMFALPLGAQPVVAPGGVLNTAGYTLDGLPNSGIAQGSMFAVFGENLGPAQLVKAAELPLPAELAGTSMEVTVNGTTVVPYLFFTSSTQLAGVLPSHTPAGQGTLTVTYAEGSTALHDGAAGPNKSRVTNINGQTSEPVTIQVVKSAFGIFTRNAAGFGPAIVQNFVSIADMPLNGFTSAAQPGQTGILWGTGLGPIAGDDSNLPPVGNLPVDVEVLVGGVSVTPSYAGRSPLFPAVDQINFPIPRYVLGGPEGCYVPVAVKVDGVVSNYGSIAVSSEGKYCSDAANLSSEALRTAEQNGELRLGNITLARSTLTAPSQAILEQEQNAEAKFWRLGLNELLASGGPLMIPAPPPGACTVFPEDDVPDDPMQQFFATSLDAGPALNLLGPAGAVQLEQRDGMYEGGFDEGYIVPGPYTVNNGAGGADIGAFAAQMTVPGELTFTNRDDLATISRSADLPISWTGGDPNNEFVAILGISADADSQVGRTFFCVERVSAGTFIVPAVILSSLPASASLANGEGALMIAGVPSVEASQFTADGLDLALFGCLDVTIVVSVTFE